MENNDGLARGGSSRRAFLSATAVTAVTAPLLTGTASAATSPAPTGQAPSEELRAVLRRVDPARIKATVLRLTQFGTRHTASSQTDPVRGIGAGNVTTVTLDISKDNVQFGLRAVDRAGHRSPVAFPQVVSS
jgi:hypothetical protein